MMGTRSKLLLLGAVVGVVAILQAAPAWAVTADFRRDGRMPVDDINRWGNNDWSRSYYYVCQVRGTDGEVGFEVIDAQDYKERLKELPQLYKEAVTQWQRDKKEADKNKEKFAEKKPAKPVIRKVSDRKYKEKEDADAYAEKLKKLWDEKAEKKRAKEEEEAPKKKAE